MTQVNTLEEDECLFVCRYCKTEFSTGNGIRYTTFPIDLNAICQTCEANNWNDLYEQHYRTIYEENESLENFISAKGYSLQKKAILDRFESQPSVTSSWTQYNDLHNSLWRLTKKGSKKSPKCLWLTLNPAMGDRTGDCKDTIHFAEMIVSSKSVTDYAYAYEWRDHKAETGFHCHMVLNGNLSKIVQHIKRTRSKNFSGRIDPKKGNKPGDYYIPLTWWDDKIRYFQGITESEEKNIKKKLDDNLRKKYNLLNIYRK